MTCQLALLLLIASRETDGKLPHVFDNYKQGYQTARVGQKPVLVVLNPGAESDAPRVDLEMLQRSKHRRDLLQKFVVVVIDTSTPEGEKVHKLFQSPQLPRISILDKQQKFQIFRTSRSLDPEDWNITLEKYQQGKVPAVPAAQCLT